MKASILQLSIMLGPLLEYISGEVSAEVNVSRGMERGLGLS